MPSHRLDSAGAGRARHRFARGARLYYLPPYSPEFNPIENAFAKLKAFQRKAAARTIDDLGSAIHHGIPKFTPTECANFLTATGYEPE